MSCCSAICWRTAAILPVLFPACLRVLRAVLVLGRDLFPTVDTGQIKLHMRAPTGTRIEETAVIADAVDKSIRENHPRQGLASILDNIGLPYSGINLSYSNSGTIGTLDTEILISLEPGHRAKQLYRQAPPRCKHLSGCRVFLPACRYRDPDP